MSATIHLLRDVQAGLLLTVNSAEIDMASVGRLHFLWLYSQQWNSWIICSSIFGFLRNLHAVSYNDYQLSHQQYVRVPFPYIVASIFSLIKHF
jgi:hypothetical protein